MTEKSFRCPNCYSDVISEYDEYGNAHCYDCNKKFSKHNENKDIYHRIWGHAIGSKVYFRELWGRLRERLKF